VERCLLKGNALGMARGTTGVLPPSLLQGGETSNEICQFSLGVVVQKFSHRLTFSVTPTLFLPQPPLGQDITLGLRAFLRLAWLCENHLPV